MPVFKCGNLEQIIQLTKQHYSFALTKLKTAFIKLYELNPLI